MGVVDSYRQIRPIFPIDRVEDGHPMTTIAGNPPRCSLFPSVRSTPSAYASWFFWDFDVLSNSGGVTNYWLDPADSTTVSMPAVNAFYAYSYPYSWSANTGREESQTISMFFLTDEQASFFHFYILDVAWDGSGGDYRMSLSGMPPTFVNHFPLGAQQPTPPPPPPGPRGPPRTSFHDGYANAQGGVRGGAHDPYPAATVWPGRSGAPSPMPSPGTLPIMLRDDPWNRYTYNSTNHRYYFHWFWYECCTDGMILGPMPHCEDDPSIDFNVTYEADCANMVGLEQGTRISMWNPRGPAYLSAGHTGSSFALCDSGASQWIHYDVPMDQTCNFTQGIQISARPCTISCPLYRNCGECTAQLECGWTNDGRCVDTNRPPSGTGIETSYMSTSVARTCSVCSSLSTAYTCMCEDGCGWAPIEGRCISGTPDYPSDQTVTVVQWETKGCPDRACPRGGPRSQCYRASYNQKRAFATSGRLMDQYAVLPATSYTEMRRTTLGQAPTASWPPPYLAGSGVFASGAPYHSGEAFFAYGTPQRWSSNTGYESPNSMVTFMVQDEGCRSYILVLVDAAADGSAGYAHIDLAYSGIAADPMIRVNDEINDPNAPIDVDTYDRSTGLITLHWGECCNDGFVLGPFPIGNDWNVTMSVRNPHAETEGLETFKIGTYDSYRNEVGFYEDPIRMASTNWGGLRYDALECTSWCQQTYDECSACVADEQCTFSAAHGGCVAADVYIYDYGCARPMYAPLTQLIHREGAAYEREAFYDGFDAALVVRYGFDSRIEMTCPCNTRYRYFATLHDVADGMRPVYWVNEGRGVPVRLNYQHTFVDLPSPDDSAIEAGRHYRLYSYLCIEQGTVWRDDCSPVTTDDITFQINPPPPSPPPPAPPAPPTPPPPSDPTSSS